MHEIQFFSQNRNTDLEPIDQSTSPIDAYSFVGSSSDSRPREERAIGEVYGSTGIFLNDPIQFVTSGIEPASKSPVLKKSIAKSTTHRHLSSSNQSRILRKRYHQAASLEGIFESDETMVKPTGKKSHFPIQNILVPEKEKLLKGPLDVYLPCARKRIANAFQSAIRSFSARIHDKLLIERGEINFPPDNQYFEEIPPAPLDKYSVVEYDMDLDDYQWLLLYNEEYIKRNPKHTIFTEDEFEAAIDVFEKEWNSLISPIAIKEDLGSDISDDACCDICGSPDATNANSIIFCDRCDVAVHQECYGVPSLPEGKWLCTRCGLLPNTLVKCILCTHFEGAFKQTDHNNWAHIACAHYIEEIGFSNETYLEPIIGTDRISPSRLKLKCFLCKIKCGAPIQCSVRHCNISFHVRCAQLANFSMDFVHKRVYCPKHTPHNSRPREYYGIEMYCHIPNSTNMIKSIDHQFFIPKGFEFEKADPLNNNGKTNTLVPVIKNHLTDENSQISSPIKVSQLPPVLPEFLFSKVMHGESWENIKSFPWKEKREESPEELENFLAAVARYWSLKRDFKGTPLLKRFFVEIENSTNTLSEEDLSQIINKLKHVRYQLEMIRSLIELTKRIFETKVKDLQLITKITHLLRNPSFYEQISTLKMLKSMDKQKYFEEPVSILDVPDYLDIIKTPMDFSTIERKLLFGNYLDSSRLKLSSKEGTVQEKISTISWELFKEDFELICSNATTYNASKTKWYKAAMSLKATGLALICKKVNIMSTFLKKAIDWTQEPTTDYLKMICRFLIPYSKRSKGDFICELKYNEDQNEDSYIPVIDVES